MSIPVPISPEIESLLDDPQAAGELGVKIAQARQRIVQEIGGAKENHGAHAEMPSIDFTPRGKEKPIRLRFVGSSKPPEI